MRAENKHDHTTIYDGPLIWLGSALSHFADGVAIDLNSPRLLGRSYRHVHRRSGAWLGVRRIQVYCGLAAAMSRNELPRNRLAAVP